MRDVQKGDLVLVDKIDRWSRDPEFSYRSMRQLVEAGARFYAVDEKIDPSTPEGDSALNFRILFAREEHKRIVIRLVRTRKTIRDQGFFIEGTPPIGYKRGPGHTLTVDPEGAKVACRIFEMCAAGRSLQYIADHFELWKGTVTRIVQNRLYLGEIQDSRGEWIRGKHTALIDAALFLRAQAGRKQRKRSGYMPGKPSTTDTWILRDVAYCGTCGRKMGSRFDRRGADRMYYRCNGCKRGAVGKTTGLFIPVREMEAAFEALVLEHLEELKDDLVRPAKKTEPVDVAAKKVKLQKRRERWLHMYEDGAIDRERLRREVSAVDEQVMQLAPPTSAPIDRKLALRTIADIARGWRHAPRRRAIVSELAVRVLLQPGKAPVPEWRSLADLLLDDD